MKTSERLFAQIRRALSLVWACSPRYTILSAVLVVFQGVLPLAVLYLLKRVVDAVASGAGATEPAAAFQRVAVLIVLAAAVALVSAATNSATNLLREAHAMAVTDHVQELLNAKSVQVDLDYYENPLYYDTLHRAQQEAAFRPAHVLEALLHVTRNAIASSVIVLLLLRLHWGVSMLLLAGALPGLFAQVRHSGRIHSWHRDRTSTERLAAYFKTVLTRDTHAKEIRLFDLGPIFLSRCREVLTRLRREKLRLLRRRTFTLFAAESATTIGTYGVFAFIGYRAVAGAISIGDFVMYYYAIQRGRSYVHQMLGGVADLYENALFLSSLDEFLKIEPKIIEPSHPKPMPRLIKRGIVFDHVSFGYPGGSRKVLEDVCFAIRPNEHVALVGENGAGKTTLVKLLCRFYDPTDGRITIDGLDLREFSLAELRRQVSAIFQDFARYQLTARENIWLGAPYRSLAEEGIVAAARHAGVDPVMAALPKGYDTILGKWFEEGEELSVGEWQKVALARAFFRDAQIIMLDEPASAMDPKAEYEVFSAFDRLTKGRTAVLISHRLSTVRMADCIHFIQDGRIVESGSHDDLLRHGGNYAWLFEMQAQHYR